MTRRWIASFGVPLFTFTCIAATGSAGATTEPGGADGACDAEITDIAIVSPYYSDQPATKEVVDAFTAGAEEAGYTVTMVDTRGDLAEVNTEMENAVAQGADTIVLGMGDPLEFGAGLAAASAAGVPVFGLDAGAADGVTANITSDNEFLGETSAQQMIDAVGDEGRVAMIHFDPFEPVRLRAEAATALFEENGIEIIEYVQGDPGRLDRLRQRDRERPARRSTRRARSTASGRRGTPPPWAPTRPPRRPGAPRSSSPASTARTSPWPRSPRARTGSPRCARTGRASPPRRWPRSMPARRARPPRRQVITVEGQLITAENAATAGTAASDGTVASERHHAASEGTAPSDTAG